MFLEGSIGSIPYECVAARINPVPMHVVSKPALERTIGIQVLMVAEAISLATRGTHN
jgi:hypothetical protein